MAFLGDFGKIFLGGATTQDVGEATGRAIGGYFGDEAGAIVGGNVGADIGKDLGEFGSSKVDVSPRPAGVDSRATLSGVSQTSGFTSSLMAGGGSGTNEAFLGGFGLPGLIAQGTRILTRPSVGGAITGLAGGAIVDFFLDEMGRQKKLVITRKMQRDVKKLFMMSGGNFNMTAELYRMATGRSITGEQVVKIITKTFKNQGPYVTKAAVRKTRSTIRKMETLCDLKDRLCPPKRATPRRRTMGSTTKVLQVK